MQQYTLSYIYFQDWQKKNNEHNPEDILWNLAQNLEEEIASLSFLREGKKETPFSKK